jgi:aminopeptidase N
MEDVSGEDLNWFFNQWYFSSGHPALEVLYTRVPESNEIQVQVKQIQEGEGVPTIFQLPVNTKVYLSDGRVKSFPVILNKREQSFVFGPFEQEVSGGVFYGDHIVLGQIEEEGWKDFSGALLMHSKEFQDKLEAANKLSKEGINPDQLTKVLLEESPIIRMKALSEIEDIDILEGLVQNDEHSSIRTKALYLLFDKSPERAFDLSKKVIKTEQAYPPVLEAISIIAAYDIDLAINKTLELSHGYTKPFYPILFDLLAASKNPAYLSYFESEVNKIDVMSIFNYFQAYRDLAKFGSVDQNLKAANLFAQVALDQTNMSFKRFIAAYSIKQLKLNLQDQVEKVEGMASKMMTFDKLIDGIIEKENEPSMKARFQSLK